MLAPPSPAKKSIPVTLPKRVAEPKTSSSDTDNVPESVAATTDQEVDIISDLDFKKVLLDKYTFGSDPRYTCIFKIDWVFLNLLVTSTS